MNVITWTIVIICGIIFASLIVYLLARIGTYGAMKSVYAAKKEATRRQLPPIL